MSERLKPGRRFAKRSLALNGALAIVKLTTGILGNSYALIADAVESLGDSFSSSVIWGGLVIAAKPADRNHPYGHGKAEPLAALTVALLLIAAGVGIAIEAIGRIKSPTATPELFTLPVLVGVIIVKEWMYRYGARTGDQIDSAAVKADAWHHRADALTSLAAVIGISIALLGGDGYQAADGWAALVACLIILANGVHFIRTAVAELMDTMPEADAAEAIASIALSVEGALDVEKVLIRKMGPSYYVDLHLEVDPQLTVHDAHAIAHAVKDEIMAARAGVADVLVHIEPHEPDRSAQTTPSRISTG